MILFVAGDVGGARVLLPVARECERQGLAFAIFDHGTLATESPASWIRLRLPQGAGEVSTGWLSQHKISCLVFASSVHDCVALALARKARQEGIFVAHLLDNWSNYRRRLEHDGLPMLVPDLYAVMDEKASDAALADGIPPEVIQVVGQPALGSLGETADGPVFAHGEGQPLRLLFVSEPVEADQGSDSSSPTFRGYTEKTVLGLLAQALQPASDRVFLSILPHPREDRTILENYWNEVKQALAGKIIGKAEAIGRRQVIEADGVIGMASILLYEAWLLGKPVLSLQPELRDPALTVLAKRPGVCFIDREQGLSDALGKWLQTIQSGGEGLMPPRPDLIRHRDAAARFVSLLVEQMERKSH